MFTFVQSKFKWTAYVSAVLGIAVPIAIGVMYWFFYQDGLMPFEAGQMSWVLLFFFLSVVIQFVTFTWLMFSRLVVLNISDYDIKSKGLFGYGAQKEWLFADLEGYSVKLQQKRHRQLTEVLVLWKSGRKVLQINEDYFDNFGEIKAAISAKLKLRQS